MTSLVTTEADFVQTLTERQEEAIRELNILCGQLCQPRSAQRRLNVLPQVVVFVCTVTAGSGGVLCAKLEEMANLEGKAAFEGVENSFPFKRCIRQGSVEVPRLWLKMATQILWNVEENWRKRKMGVHIGTAQGGFHQMCSYMRADNCWILSQSKEHLKQMVKELVNEVGGWDTEPKPTSKWWTSTNAEEERENLVVDTATGQHKLPCAGYFEIFCFMFSRDGKM